MRHFIVSVLVILGFATVTRGAPIIFSLEMDQDPLAAGWTVHPGTIPGTHSVADGLLTVNSPSFYEFYAPNAVMQALSNSAGWAIDARFKFTGGAFMTLWVWDRTELNRVDIGQSSIRVYPGAVGFDLVYPYNIGTDFHTYRLEGIGENIRMTVDGQVAFDTVHLGQTGGTQVIYFGDGWEGGATTSVWDYWRITTVVPEPGAGVVCLLGAAAVMRRRYRRRRSDVPG